MISGTCIPTRELAVSGWADFQLQCCWVILKEWQPKLLLSVDQKKSATKIQVPCPDVIKMHNKGMGVVELIAQGDAAYHLDWKSTIRFYLRIFFDLMCVACANMLYCLQYDASQRSYTARF